MRRAYIDLSVKYNTSKHSHDFEVTQVCFSRAKNANKLLTCCEMLQSPLIVLTDWREQIIHFLPICIPHHYMVTTTTPASHRTGQNCVYITSYNFFLFCPSLNSVMMRIRKKSYFYTSSTSLPMSDQSIATNNTALITGDMGYGACVQQQRCWLSTCLPTSILHHSRPGKDI